MPAWVAGLSSPRGACLQASAHTSNTALQHCTAQPAHRPGPLLRADWGGGVGGAVLELQNLSCFKFQLWLWLLCRLTRDKPHPRAGSEEGLGDWMCKQLERFLSFSLFLKKCTCL